MQPCTVSVFLVSSSPDSKTLLIRRIRPCIVFNVSANPSSGLASYASSRIPKVIEAGTDKISLLQGVPFGYCPNESSTTYTLRFLYIVVPFAGFVVTKLPFSS